MKTLVIYDSYFGNTEKIANAIGKELKGRVVKVSDIKPSDYDGLDVLVVGSPTRAFNPTPAITNFIKSLDLDGIKVAAFDTRMDVSKAPGILKFLAGIFGYAAEPMNKKLIRNGGKEIVEPIGFMVEDTEGPLEEGELERAKKWAQKIR